MIDPAMKRAINRFERAAIEHAFSSQYPEVGQTKEETRELQLDHYRIEREYIQARFCLERLIIRRLRNV